MVTSNLHPRGRQGPRRFLLGGFFGMLAGTLLAQTATAPNPMTRKNAVALGWRKGDWRAGVSAYYIGSYQDTGATTTAATYAALGAPNYISEVYDTGLVRYRYVVSDSISYNAYFGYEFRGSRYGWLNATSLRLGVVNLTDAEPPLSSAGYDPAVYGSLARGRSWSVQVSKRF